MKKMQYWSCPYCGSNLDYGEKCDCDRERIQRERLFAECVSADAGTGQLSLRLDRIGNIKEATA